MEEKELVQREKKSVRSYRSKITLTEKGKDVADFVAKRAAIAVAAVSGEIMTDEERRFFYSILDTIHKNLLKIGNEGIPTEE